MSLPGFRAPSQSRSRETLERIVTATESLLLERGPDGVTVHDVVDRASSSVGSFYARFDDRDAAIRYVQDRFWRAAEARWREYLDPARWEDRSAVQVVARFVRSFVRAMTLDRRRYRMFLLQALREPAEDLVERTAALDDAVADGVARLLAPPREGSSAPDAVEEVREGVLRVIAATRDALVFGEPTPAADRRLALSLIGMLCAHLGLEGIPRTWSEVLELEAEPLSARNATKHDTLFARKPEER